MKLRKLIGALMMYLPFCALFAISIFSLCHNLSKATDEIERAISIWRDALLISTAIGLLGNMYVVDRLTKLVIGEPINIVKDFVEKDSKEVSVSFNGLLGTSLSTLCLLAFISLYIRTRLRLFLICSIILSAIVFLGTVADILAHYLQYKQEKYPSIVSKLSDPIMLPLIICFLLLVLTNNTIVGSIYRNIQAPQSTISQIIAIIAVLCYIPAMAYCHFSNLYCLTAFAFVLKKPETIQDKLDAIQEKNAKRENNLRQTTEYINEKARRVGFIKRRGLAIRFFCTHIKAYFQERLYSVLFILSFIRLKLVQVLSGLLTADRIKTNTIRFCEIMVVFELLVLDMLLYLRNEDSCSRFFELLSTVIIIPIILSSLANLKTKKDMKS